MIGWQVSETVQEIVNGRRVTLSVRTLYAHFRHHKLPFLCVPLSTYPCISVSQFLLVSSSSLQFQLLSVANLTLSLLYIPLCFFFPNFTFFQRSLPSSVSCHHDYFFNYKVLLFSVTPSPLSLSDPCCCLLWSSHLESPCRVDTPHHLPFLFGTTSLSVFSASPRLPIKLTLPTAFSTHSVSSSASAWISGRGALREKQRQFLCSYFNI